MAQNYSILSKLTNKESQPKSFQTPVHKMQTVQADRSCKVHHVAIKPQM